MSKSLIVGILVPSIFAVIIGLVIATYISYNNATIRYAAQFKAQEQRIEASFDDMWKSIKQIAQVDDKYRQDIQDIIVGNSEARSQGAGSLATMVTEAIPNIDPSTANRLINVIDGRREGFKRDQGILVAIAQENNILVQTFPGSLFLSESKLLEAKIISSDRTKDAIANGENDVSVY
jgi:hypothetical protein